ncbi:MAG: glycosyltransferase, partial [Anaerolineales bacterium]
LVIVGDGPELPGLQDWAARAGVGAKVIFAGAAEYEDVPAYLRLADAFATASKTEVHPLSLIEAMASGLPAIGVRSPGIEDTIENGVNGILCRDDLAEFTAQMVRLMLEDDRRKEMAGRARTDADRFDITRTSQLLLEQYQQLQHERPRHSPGLVQRLKRFIL